ncbi:glycosyltransferase [Aeromonas veronii]|uniref:glycosyltransferase n=1 Tax=Aeromonas veronii TaxID=654 RepID=UPI003A4AE163
MIAIIIATYNSQATIRQCLESILKQSLKEVEVIIQDGGSNDDTLSIIEEMGFSSSVISQKDSGVYHAWNLALTRVTAQWVTFLGSDDYFKEDDSLSSIRSEIDIAESLKSRIIYGKNIIVDLDDKLVCEIGDKWEISQKNIYRFMTVRHPGCFCHITLFKEIGGFDESFKIIGDYDFVLRSIAMSSVYYYDFPAVCHRIGGLSISPARCMQVIKETYRLRKKHKLKPFLYMDIIFFKRLTLFFLSIFLKDDIIFFLIKRLKGR